MFTRQLGRSTMTVSALGMGCWGATRSRIRSCEDSRKGGSHLEFCLQCPAGLNQVRPGQCSRIRTDGFRTVRGRGDCKHQRSPELGLDGMANTCEPLLNVVIHSVPKVLTGTAVVGSGVPSSPDADTLDHRRRGGAFPILGMYAERGKPDALPLGKRVARRADRVAGTGRGSKRTPAGNRWDRG
jgi:hypothetical protein